MTIGLLAERLEVAQQTASESVADLERRGYVARTPDPADARARLVALTDRGHGAIDGARRHRAALGAELSERLGPRRVEAAGRLLDDVVAELGADSAVRDDRGDPARARGRVGHALVGLGRGPVEAAHSDPPPTCPQGQDRRAAAPRLHRAQPRDFIRKGIGWALREYSKTDPDGVERYCASVELSPLSRREALRSLDRIRST